MAEEAFEDALRHDVPAERDATDRYIIFTNAGMREYTDRIRKAHDGACEEQYARGYHDALSGAVTEAEAAEHARAEYERGRVDGASFTLDHIAVDTLSDRGLARLPRDADGIAWTGCEREYVNPGSDAGRSAMAGLVYANGLWYIQDRDGSHADAGACRHVPEKPAGPHAALAAELRSAVRKGYEHGYGSAGDYRAALYNIAERLAQMDGDDGQE